jgi:type I restriction enzyme S subunit
MELTKGYKKTDIGVLPNEWEPTIISKVCKLINGRGFKPHEWDKEGLPIIRIQNLNGSDEYNYFKGAYDKKIEIRDGQLLFAWSGSRGTSFGPHVWRGEMGLLNYHTWKIEINETAIEKNFFLHALKNLTKYIEDKAHGASALVHTQKWEMEKFYFPCPNTKAEQTAIANALSDADALISSLEKLIEKKRNIKQGAMQELLKPKKGWVLRKLGEFLDYEQPTDYLVSDTEYDDFNQTPVLTAGKTFILGYTNEEHGIFKKLPVIIFDDFTTAIKYVDFPFKAKSSAMKMLIPKNEDVNLRFVFELMLQIKYLPGDHKRHWIGEYRQMEVVVPSKESEQNEIASILSDMDNEIALLEKKLSKSKMLKQGMMQELLTGKIRLI